MTYLHGGSARGTCSYCGDPIPATLRQGVRYCSRKCSRDAHKTKTGAKKRVKVTAGMYRPALLDLRLREREQAIVSDARERLAA